MTHRYRVLLAFVVVTLMLAGIRTSADAQATNPINHIIVVYMENWSFDALYGTFPGANGISNAGSAAPQVDKTGKFYDVFPPALTSNKKDSYGKSTIHDCIRTNLPN